MIAMHKRRGHVRHLWKRAGVERSSLPENAGARLKLCVERDVKRIYVRPHWVGPWL